MTSEEAIKKFKEEYYKACADESIIDPVAYASYITYLYALNGPVCKLSDTGQILYDMSKAAMSQLLLRKKMRDDK